MIKVRNFALSTMQRRARDPLRVRFREHRRRARAAPRRCRRARASSASSATASRRATSARTKSCARPWSIATRRPMRFPPTALRYRLQIGSRGEKTIALAIGCRSANQPVQIATLHAFAGGRRGAGAHRRPAAVPGAIRPTRTFNAWMQRSAADIGMMLTATPHGRVPAAGLPWLDAAFGRDAIITALADACGCGRTSRATCCAYLAATQSADSFAANGAEPGKILNEARGGDIAPNYFGVDTTPLFVLLAGAYYARTADLDFIAELWPAIIVGAALDRRVRRHRRRRLRRDAAARAGHPPQHGWKSSPDAMFHADGASRDRAARAVRSAGLRVRREARGRAHRAFARRDAARHRAGRSRAGAAGEIQQPRSGARTSRPSRRRSTATSNAAACAPRIPGIACTPASRTPSARARSSPASATNTCSPAGACARWPRASCASTRCRITTAPSGRTTTRCSRPAPRATTTRPSRCASSTRSSTPRGISTCCACRSCSAVSGAGAARRRCSFRWRVRRSRVPRRARSCCCRACSAFRSMRSTGRSCWRIRSCRKASRRSAVKNLEVGEASVDFTVRRHAGSVSVSVERSEGKLDLVIRS